MNIPATCALSAAMIAVASCTDPFQTSPTGALAPASSQAPTERVAAPSQTESIDSLDSLSMDDAVRIAIANSPSLRSARHRVDAASGRIDQSGRYPNPVFVFDGEGLAGDSARWGETAYHLEQEIILGDKIEHARAVAQADHRAAQTEAVAHESALAADTRRAYVAALAADAVLADHLDLAELASQLARAVDATADAGGATETDRLRARVALEQAQTRLEEARLDAAAARRTLALVMGLDGSIALPLTSSLDEIPTLPSHDELAAAVLDANPRLSIARTNLERARSAHRLAQADAIPNLVASVGPRYSDADHETTIDVGLGIEIPLFDRNQGTIRAALAERLSAVEDVRAVQLQLLAQLEQAWAQHEASRLVVDRYRQRIMPGSQRTLDLTRQAYQNGKIDYLRLLDAQEVFINARLDYVKALQRLHDAAATLHQLAQLHTPWRTHPIDSTKEDSQP